MMFAVLFFASGCGGENEHLDDDEIEYVHLAVALGKVKALAADSADHAGLRDSVLRSFSTTEEAFIARTESFADAPDRAAIVFRAIRDSLGIR